MAIETNELIDVQTLSPFKKFIMTIGNLPTSYLESMTYAELLMWFCNYLQETVIPTVNNNAEAVEELQGLYTQLETYVNEYFENLDVQDEINIKLDAMAQDGSLTALIKNYVDPYIDIQNNAITNIQNEVIEIDNKVTSVASGSPAGVYATVSDLETADPDHTKIYVVTATGNWYYYSNSTWNSGGTYQASAINVGDIKPWQTSFYDNVNIYPKNNYITGKVLNVNDGTERTWANGSYNPEYIAVDNTKKYIVINNSVLAYSQPTFYTYDSSKAYLGYVRPATSDRKGLVTFGNTVAYIRVSFWDINTSTLTNNCVFIKEEDALKLLSYEKNYFIKNNNFNAIDTKDIIIDNKYEFRLVPFQAVPAGNAYNTLRFPTIYEIDSTNSAVSGNNFIGLYFTFKSSSLEAGDKIYVDTTDSTAFNNCVLFETQSSSSNTLNGTDEGNGIYSFTLTSTIISNMESTLTSGYYPRIILTRTGQTAGTTLTTNMRVWINEDFTNLTAYLEDVKDVLEEYDQKTTLSALVLGDSITALTGSRSWLTYFNNIQPINVIQNVAVNGAWLMDKEGTIYDGNPVFNGPDNNVNNVLGNQVQKIINNNYTAPDIIMIAVGTNGGISCSKQDIYNSYYDASGNLIPLEDVDRKTSAGAFRYCNETLRTLYPNATIFWCSPIQAYYGLKKPDVVIGWGDNLKNLCEFSSVQFIDTQDCGITAYTEYNGSNGLYLIDGLHPNANGAKYMGYYNATKVKEYTEACKLHNQ